MFHISFIATMTGLGRIIIQLLARWLPGTALIGALSFVEMLYAAADAHRTITGCTAIRRASVLRHGHPSERQLQALCARRGSE
ncbi:hypothetical protein N5E83_11295 [Stutzerimonas stutzeri]|uniref:hypothetical protein n=1 Tax=Stutzerimonas stutzeri TaxID=316 RepID=UPI0005A29D09|nr:hypothetical protein [Stutzerimonas stutzeri]MDH1541328.1 hypothetical protein [Stutzerimonas stutzeri]UNL97162.1 hypothetical protein IGX38_12635 [Stutzerimonas stutzeri]UWG62274.1 hypothetical protein NDR94_09130 [Stutzerimonas stutzeri]